MRSPSLIVRALLAASLAVSGAVVAIAPVDENPVPDDLVLPTLRAVNEAIEVQVSLLADAGRDLGVQTALAPFRQRHGGDWQVRWDSRGNRANVVQGSGVPLLLGNGNSITDDAVTLTGDMQTDLPVVAALARQFIDGEQELLATDGLELHLDPDRSTGFGPGNERWFIEFQQFHDGIPVDGAFVYVRIVHGNVVQFGAERVGDVHLSANRATVVDRENAFAQAWQQLGFPAGTRVIEWVDPGELRVFPTLPAGQQLAQPHTGLRGLGYDHLLAWRFVFRVDHHTILQVLFDTESNRVVDIRNLMLNADAEVSGGVYPTTNTDPQVIVPFPFTAVSHNGSQVTDIDGVYDYTGGTASTVLNGRYFRMVDNCGSISLSNDTDGNLAFGTSDGTDCTTPGIGGAGNTHATRTGFYHLTLINTKARSILPDNTWLQGTVTANMNVNNQCNATWGGNQANFYRSGGGCSNTGEIAAVFLHEWGHGLDHNTGGAASENGSGEAVGDTFAFLETRDSCIGPNFRPGVPCHNCTTCTGVRDIGDFALSGTRTIATPANVAADDGINCDRLACPYYSNGIFPYQGPMKYEGHCESYIASGANWDLKNALVEEFGEAGWQTMDDIWYGSLVPSKSAYQVVSGGTCNPAASVDGCGATNWFTVFLATDDDDGDLANGTPNGCRIWDAFEAHGIACGTRPACTASGTPDFSLAIEPATQAVCAGSTASYTIDIGSSGGFDAPVTLSLEGNDQNLGADFDPNPVVPAGTSILTIEVPAGFAAGSLTMSVAGTASGSAGHTRALTLDTLRPPDDAIVLLQPANGATKVALPATLEWQAVTDADSYAIEVATDADFDTVVASADGVTATHWSIPALDEESAYFWRVRADNACGDGTWSAAFGFTTRPPEPSAWPVGGEVDGLLGEGLSLTLNDGPPLIITEDGSFTFPDELEDGTIYAVAIASQPTRPSQTCAVSQGKGTVEGGPVTDIQIDCEDSVFHVGGLVEGLIGSGLVLSLNGSEALPIEADGLFGFTTGMTDGAAYQVTVTSEPHDPIQTCTVEPASGNIDGADVDDVLVTCSDRLFYDGFE